jgi:amino acid adenylation domain-containing protein
VVVAYRQSLGDDRLVAYYVAGASVAPTTTSLRQALIERLPESLVPSAFVGLDKLPLLPNGKIDHKALPTPPRPLAIYRAPRTAPERVLCELFAAVLELDQVGIDDHFFELGGHSLLAARLVSRVRGCLGVELPIRSLFEAPNVARLAPLLSEARKARAPLIRQAPPDRLPLSHAQARLWFLDRLEGPGATYNIPLAVRLEGELVVFALETALADVVARHESLRTIFPDEGGVPFQQVLTAAEARPCLVTVEVTEAALAESMARAAATGIELDREIPLRAWLFRIDPEQHVLLILLHHIAGDGWSLGPLIQDLTVAYSARKRGQSPAFDDLPVQYADYTLWQRSLLGDHDDPDSPLAHQLQFWINALAGLPEELDLPCDHPRPPVASFRGASVPIALDPNLHQKLLDLARDSGASLFMLLQAGLAALLSRLGAGDDIPIGTPVAGRGDHALEHLVGFFVNTLVLRNNLSGNPSFRQIIRRVRAFDLDAYDYQDLPFERLVEALQPARSLARHPLFQVALVLQSAPTADFEVPGLRSQRVPLALRVAKFDLTIGLRECRGPGGQPLGMEGWLEYSQDLFEEETARDIAARYVRLLTAAVAAPDLSLHQFDVLDTAERHALLEVFNGTASSVPDATLTELFEAQAARTPGALALVFEQQEMNYDELNTRANALAHHLIGLGVGPEDRVGICLQRSPQLVVAILGILKAGAAYLPLDPGLPTERLELLVRETSSRVLGTTDSLERLPATAQVLALDAVDIREALGRAATDNPTDADRKTAFLPDHPAYIIFTSGSTGTPKGVVVTHAGIPVLAVAQVERLGITPKSRVLQFASLSFDASLWEIVMALTSGPALVLPRDDQRAGPALLNVIKTQRVTHATLPPIVLATLDDSDALPLEALIVAGEACPGELAARWSRGRRMINAYGPTETTVCATMSPPLSGSQTPSIGTPIRGFRAYVLD